MPQSGVLSYQLRKAARAMAFTVTATHIHLMCARFDTGIVVY